MGIITEHQTVERIQFFDGQRLFASDMQAVETYNREMRWLHNQSLHQPGIGKGFSVTGKVGNRQMTVTPGYAIDSLGREIVLTQKRILSIPPVADDGFGNSVNYDLAISYPADSLLEEAKTRETIQLSNNAVRLREEPVFHWVELDLNLQPQDENLKKDIKNGLKIILKRVAVQNCKIKSIYTDLKPRKAQPEKLPRIFAGKTDPQKTDWKFWTKTYDNNNQKVTVKLGLKASVDTSAARFNSKPRYFARVAGKRFVIMQGVDPVKYLFVFDGFVNIAQANGIPFERGFEIRLLMPYIDNTNTGYPLPVNDLGLLDKYFDDVITKLNWHVIWMGIER